MIYSIEISTPASTTALSPLRTRFPVTKGLIHSVEVYFPPGSVGLLGVAVYDGNYQFFPASNGQYFHGDNLLLRYDEMYDKTVGPFELVVVTHNDDDTYAHTLRFAVGQVSKDEYRARFLGGMGQADVTAVLAQIQSAQAATRAGAIAELTARFARK